MQVEIIISGILAYVLCGALLIDTDLHQDVFLKPTWALKPTWWGMLLVGAMWPLRPFMTRQDSRTIAFSVVEIILRFVIFSFFFWGVIAILKLFISNIILVTVITIITMPLTSMIFFPLTSVLMLPLFFLLTLPLGIIFPLKKRDE